MSAIKQQSKPVKKKKAIKNTFDIMQFKKMTGKGLVTVWSGIVIDKKTMNEEIKKIKDKVLNGSVKSIALTGYLNNGIIYIFSGVERLHVINSISYSELKKTQIEIEVIINQYPKLTKEEIISLS
jgi:hypothetical protein